MTNYLTRKSGKEVSNQLPLQVHNVAASSDRTTVSGESVTFNSAGAQSSVGMNAFDKGPILNLSGTKVGSFWGEDQNLMIAFTDTSKFGTLTETNGSASVVITDPANLEKMFETASGSRRYILKAIDSLGAVLYGWIGNITVSGTTYTIPTHDAVSSGNQNWKGSTSGFDNAAVRRIEIYSYQSSLVFGTGTVLTEEVAFDEERVQEGAGATAFLNSLTDGQFGVNYRSSAIFFKKATTGTSDTVSYTTFAGGGSTASDDSAFTPGTSDVTPVGYLADETATDSIDEGDVGIARMTLDRKQIIAGSYLDDAAFTPAAAGSYFTMIGAFADETAPDSVDEGDGGALRMTLTRFLKVSLGDLLSGEDQTNSVFQVVEKPLSVSTYCPDLDTSTALEASSVSKASAGVLYGFSASNTNATGHYIQFFNSTTVPADTTVPVLEFFIAGEGTIEKEWPKGRPFTTGISWCISSTNGAKTIAGASALTDVNYK